MYSRTIIKTLIILSGLLGSVLQAREYHFVTLEFPPYEYLDKKTLHPKGFAVDRVQQIAKRNQLNIKILVLPWTRSLSMAKKGEADAIFTIYKNPDREQFLDFSNEVLAYQIVSLFIHKNRTIKYDPSAPLKSLKQYTFGVVSTISYGSIFDNFKKNLQLETVHNLEANLRKLKSSRVDIVPYNYHVAKYTIDNNIAEFSNSFKLLVHPLQEVPSYIAFTKKKNLTELKAIFDQELKTLGPIR
ncbi:substrate-binding periplasmic protein [Spartinivicinus ruber]|uniref:substrate-binding periplasmic protein n=1 Tax=Spartinivicinus ruber TaxID=2683272 RepID=UPI0013D60783|nr:transporter substrate-binding domain-containing protein [Spartinivicinus ruber]